MLLLLGFCLISCSVRINGSLSADGSAVVSVNMSLEAGIRTLLQRLSAAGGQQEQGLLDGPSIARSMTDTPGISSVNLRNTSPHAIEGQIRISHIGNFLAAEQNRFINFEQGALGGRFNISINRDNGPIFLELLSPDISDYLNVLMAPIATGEQMSKQEYLGLITSFYNKTISDEIAASRVHVSLEFPGPITSIRGGTFSGRRAVFDIPLLDLFVLETPIIFEVNWN